MGDVRGGGRQVAGMLNDREDGGVGCTGWVGLVAGDNGGCKSGTGGLYFDSSKSRP